MKVNEIINEGPLWDKMKGVARGVQGAVQGYQTSKTNRTAAEPILAAAKQVAADWAKQKAQLAVGGVQPTLANFAQFMQPRTPTVVAPTAADFANPAAYIQTAVAQHFANRSNGVAAPNATTTQNGPASPDVTDTIVPRPGKKIVVTNPDNKGIYYKTTRGWTDQYSNPITKPQSIAYLDKIADSAGKEIPE